ncbi:flagellar protein export ATPase FliI [Fusibacter tunisiensis]|uniref:Flagellum-specific ATP synthase n=1 Tax=Fusibacter tunisiensis TaxID=1008308 RepID=A0ABS2MMG7_9FIRM|nr:flagellar protein export ATPase FliI [Fusibacter tunisiensis]MBM7560583.1 flagellum-specific ATP synthase [Fusibacter tunisiensis]
MLERYKQAVEESVFLRYSGRVSKIVGLMIESIGPAVEIGEVCDIFPIKGTNPLKGEVVGFNQDKVLLMPLGDMIGIGPGSRVVATGHALQVEVSEAMLGRIFDGLGNPIDEMAKPAADQKYPANNDPPNPLFRDRIDAPMPLGIKAIDGLLTCGKGQRIGIFAGSGVGKSTLLGMIAKYTKADVNVIALVGERGREVREFIENELGEEGLKRSVVVVATSDKPALVRVKAALIATSIAEFFRDSGKNVILMMDSVTRFSMAQREIGLAVGEPPVTRGYTPSVFAMLPRLLERAGNSSKGSITGLYTVLVDGDDFNEPISDAVRGILDGHIMLSRKLASLGHYPAIDVLDSTSRVMPNIVDEDHLLASMRFKEVLATYRNSEDLINIGAYAKGTNPHIDLAIDKYDDFITFLKQRTTETLSFEESKSLLKDLIR